MCVCLCLTVLIKCNLSSPYHGVISQPARRTRDPGFLLFLLCYFHLLSSVDP